MKDLYITITGFKHYYGIAPFKIGQKLKCTKEPNNPFDSEAIKVTIKHIGTVGYVANSPFTKATGTIGSGGIWTKVRKKFKVKVMFITSTKIICKVVDGFKGSDTKAKREDFVENIHDSKTQVYLTNNDIAKI